jgi:hypothetical protein
MAPSLEWAFARPRKVDRKAVKLGFRHLAGRHREFFMADLAEAGDIAVNPDIEGGIGQDQIDGLISEQAGVIAVGAGVPAQQAVRAQDPEVALSRDGRCNQGRKKVFRTRFDRPLFGCFVQDRIDLAQRKAGDFDVVELQV